MLATGDMSPEWEVPQLVPTGWRSRRPSCDIDKRCRAYSRAERSTWWYDFLD